MESLNADLLSQPSQKEAGRILKDISNLVTQIEETEKDVINKEKLE